MADTPEFIDSKKVFEGRVFDVTVDTVRENGETYIREVVHHKGSAVILRDSVEEKGCLERDGVGAGARDKRHRGG